MTYARSLMDYLRTLGIQPTQIFTTEEVAAIEGSDGNSRDSLNHWLSLLAQAVQSTADPETPLKVGASFKIRHLGLVGHVLMSCSTLDDVWKQAHRYVRLLGDVGGPRLVHRRKVSQLHLQWRTDEPPPPAMQQIFLAASASLGRWLTDRPDLIFDACFQMKRPRHVSEYTRLFRGELLFGQRETKLIFPTSYLELPVASANPLAMKIVEAQAQTMLREMQKNENYGEQTDLVSSVMFALNHGMPIGRVTLTEVAPLLRLSRRTLQRRLTEGGVTFLEILERARRTRAETLLGDPSISLAEVAFMLGYTEQSTFQQAFKRWTGATPGGYRAHLTAKRDAT
jgi:AraC-like DNA-binding protein